MWVRYNSVSKIYEYSNDNGASFFPLPLTAGLITEGTFNDARLSANIPRLNANNVFTADQVLEFGAPKIVAKYSSGAARATFGQSSPGYAHVGGNLYYTGAAWNSEDTTVGGGALDIGPAGLYLYTAPAGANPKSLSTIFRVDTTGALYEKGKATSFDQYQTQAFAASDYGTAGGGSVWTPLSASTISKFSVGGDNLTWQFVTSGGGAITVAATSFISIRVPEGRTLSQRIDTTCAIIANGTYEVGLLLGLAGENYVRVYRWYPGALANWAIGTVEVRFSAVMGV